MLCINRILHLTASALFEIYSFGSETVDDSTSSPRRRLGLWLIGVEEKPHNHHRKCVVSRRGQFWPKNISPSRAVESESAFRRHRAFIFARNSPIYLNIVRSACGFCRDLQFRFLKYFKPRGMTKAASFGSKALKIFRSHVD